MKCANYGDLLMKKTHSGKFCYHRSIVEFWWTGFLNSSHNMLPTYGPILLNCSIRISLQDIGIQQFDSQLVTVIASNYGSIAGALPAPITTLSRFIFVGPESWYFSCRVCDLPTSPMWRWNLVGNELAQWHSLFTLIQSVPIRYGIADSISWVLSSSNSFSIKSCYLNLVSNFKSMCFWKFHFIWKSIAPRRSNYSVGFSFGKELKPMTC